MTVAFFDLDRTLLDCNSGRLWMQSEWNAGRLPLSTVAWAAFWLGKYHLGLGGGMNQALRQAAATLKGDEEVVLKARTEEWFSQQVAHRIRPGAIEAIQRHVDAGHRVALATSASVYEANAAAEAWGLERGFSTEFEVVDGVFTGEISRWAFGMHKVVRAHEWLSDNNETIENAVFYTDSNTDRFLLTLVGKPVVVNPDRALFRYARKQGWPIVDWGESGAHGKVDKR